MCHVLQSELNVKEAELVSKKLSEFLLLVFKQPKTTTLEDFGIKKLALTLLTIFASNSYDTCNLDMISNSCNLH